MSRSYKKTPHGGCAVDKSMKVAARRHVRRLLKRDHDLTMDGNEYKKFFCSWLICDYSETPRSFYEWYKKYDHGHYNGFGTYIEPLSIEEAWDLYQRWYVRK